MITFFKKATSLLHSAPSLIGRAGGESNLFAYFVYVAGTAVAIASAMVIAIVFNMMLADIPPESHRSRTLYSWGFFATESMAGQDVAYHQGFSTTAIDSCFRQMASVEAATGIIPAMQNRYTASVDGIIGTSISATATDPSFFRLFDLRFLDGRPFSEQEFRNGERVCVITDKVRERIGCEASIFINNLPFRVVGVVKAVSAFLGDATADAYVPYTVDGLGLHPDNHNPLRNGDNYVDVSYAGNLNLRLLLREGYSRQHFLDELEPLRQHYGAVISSQMGEKVDWILTVRSNFFRIMGFFRPESNEDQNLALEAKNLSVPALLMLFFLLLPAINLSGLVSNRMEVRRAEMGIRKAFGAKRRTLLREVINENLVLTLCGGAVGWVLSWLFILAIRSNAVFLQLFVSRDQNATDTSLDFQMFVTPTLFLIIFLCCVLLNLMAALIPAWRSLRSPIVESLSQKK
ncbi:MAG: ABC transporter permease [Bacteroidaceae bacterium]|nr:ABC transporter permease [Bacteroidaceae bacterium]